MSKNKDRARELREAIAVIVEDFVPATDARRVMDDVDELVRLAGRTYSEWDGRKFS